MASASVPAPKFLPWLPALTFFNDGPWCRTLSLNIPFPLQVPLGHGVYQRERKRKKKKKPKEQ